MLSVAALSRDPRVASRGFTLVEVMMVTAIVVLVMAMLFPRVHAVYAATQVRSAGQEVRAYLTAARAAALQQGRTTVFYARSQRIWVTTESGGAQVVYRVPVRLDAGYGVALTATKDSIVYNGRGIATGLSGTQAVTVSKGGTARSVCVSALGSVFQGVCS